MRTSSLRTSRVVVAGTVIAALLGTVTPTARAQVYTWRVPTGSFQDASSWGGSGPPGAADAALFTGPGNQLVTFVSDWAVSNLTVGDVISSTSGSINFALNGHTLTANSLTF